MIDKLIALLLLCAGVGTWGQAPLKPPVLVKAGKLFDAQSGRIVPNQGILIEGEKIKEVGDISTVAAHAPNATVIDLSAATVLPGLIASFQRGISYRSQEDMATSTCWHPIKLVRVGPILPTTSKKSVQRCDGT